MRKKSRMTYEHQKRVAAWVRANLVKNNNMSIAELARRLKLAGVSGMEPTKISHSLGLRRRFTALEIEKMEIIFGAEFRASDNAGAELAFLNKSLVTVSFGETIAIGYRTHSMHSTAQRTEIPPVLLPRYATTPQEAWPVEGDCCDLYATDGMIVFVVDYWKFRPSLQIGDKIVVKRYHPLLVASGDKSQSENSLRLVAMEDGQLILKSLSTNKNIVDILYDPDDKSIEIIKLVIGKAGYERY